MAQSSKSTQQRRVAVITGASSGLGRATALELARRGFRLGLIARDSEGLASLLAEIRSEGSDAVTCLADVTDSDQVQHAAAETVNRFGRLDVWINNAAVALYGESDQVPLNEMRRLMDVNFFGQVIGTRAALPFLETNQEPTCLVGILSVLAEAALPLQSAYVASKHALFGFYKSLACELRHRRSRVRIATYFAPSMATPIFDHAKTYVGFRPKPVSPVFEPERIAVRVADLVERPRFKAVEPISARGVVEAFRRFLGPSIRFEGRFGHRSQRSAEIKGADAANNLYLPMSGFSRVRGSSAPSRLLSVADPARVPEWLRRLSAIAFGVASGLVLHALREGGWSARCATAGNGTVDWGPAWAARSESRSA